MMSKEVVSSQHYLTSSGRSVKMTEKMNEYTLQQKQLAYQRTYSLLCRCVEKMSAIIENSDDLSWSVIEETYKAYVNAHDEYLQAEIEYSSLTNEDDDKEMFVARNKKLNEFKEYAQAYMNDHMVNV